MFLFSAITWDDFSNFLQNYDFKAMNLPNIALRILGALAVLIIGCIIVKKLVKNNETGN